MASVEGRELRMGGPALLRKRDVDVSSAVGSAGEESEARGQKADKIRSHEVDVKRG